MRMAPRQREWLPALAVMVIVALAVSLFVMFNQLSLMSGAVRGNYWNTAQTETEFLRLKRTLELYVSRSELVTHDDVMLRLDIFHSRIKALRATGTYTEHTKESFDRLSGRLGDMAGRLDALVTTPDFRDGPAGPEAIALMTEAWLPLHGWVRDIIHGELWVNERVDMIAEQRTLIFVNLALLLIGLAVVSGILRGNRKMTELAQRERRARVEMEMALDARDRFVAGMSHELRTPLNAIVGFSDMLATGIHGDLKPRQAEYVSDISQSGQYLLSLINDILDYSKLEANMHEPEFTRVDLKAIVAEGLKLIEPTVLARGAEVVFEKPEGDVAVETDRRFALQCLVNLLSNAAKFSPPRGRIEITLRPTRDAVAIDVRDEGPGMTDEQIATAFEPFKQFSDPYTAKSTGTGLGLALTKSFCEILGARLLLRRAPAGGLEATIVFTRSRGAITEDISEQATARAVTSSLAA
jgi:signal transduction histidine kinase